MNHDRQARNRMYERNLYKQYLILMKSVSLQKKKNKVLKNTNSELSKKLNQLRLEVKKSSAHNTNLKVEIYDVAVERKNIMEDSKKICEQVASLHSNISDIEKKLYDILSSRSCRSRHETQASFSMPLFNGQMMPNPRTEPIRPEANLQRYNFKDCVYFQDLSPIIEESADKKLAKLPDITRRLGHRAKAPHQFASPEIVETSGLATYEHPKETNTPRTSMVIQTENENITFEHQPHDRESDLTNGSIQMGKLSSTPHLHHSSFSFTTTKVSSTPLKERESGARNVYSPLLTTKLRPSNGKDRKGFSPSIFANVFPRRKKINDSDCRLSIEEDILENGDDENKTDLNSQYLVISDSAPSGRSLQQSVIDETSLHNGQKDAHDPDVTSPDESHRSKTTEAPVERTDMELMKRLSNSTEDEKIENRRQSLRSSSIGSPMGCAPNSRSTPKPFQEEKEEVEARSLRSNSHDSEQCLEGRSSGKRSSSFILFKVDSSKSLRAKKPMNFAESPIIGDKKRLKKKKNKV